MILITAHAEEQGARRNIAREMVLDTVENPQQRVAGTGGRQVYQSQYFDNEEEKQMLLRVIVATRGEDLIAISVYKTSKIGKYWLEEPEA